MGRARKMQDADDDRRRSRTGSSPARTATTSSPAGSALPIVPVVFGVDDATLATLKGAIETMVHLAGHRMAETDPEQGANLIIFFLGDWEELLTVPDLDRLVEGLGPLVARLGAEGANQYRHFRLEEKRRSRACIAFLKVEGDLAELPAETVALGLAQMILLWSDTAFRNASPLALVDGTAILRPDVANLIRAAYDPGAARGLRTKAMRSASRRASGQATTWPETLFCPKILPPEARVAPPPRRGAKGKSVAPRGASARSVSQISR